MKWILSLFLCFKVSAQLPVIPYVIPPSGIPDPTSVAGLRFWWHSGDLALNTKVTNWIDRVSGVSCWTNQSTTLQPTNSSGGVGFDGTTYLTNSTPFTIETPPANQTGSVVMVVAPVTSVGSIGGIFNASSVGGQGFYFTSAHQARNFFSAGSGILCDWVSSDTKDYYCVITNASLGQNLFYTNNVFINIAAGLGDPAGSGSMKFLFHDGTAGGNPGKGKLLDLLVYYTNLTASGVATIHKWATNTYNFAP